MAVDVTRLVMDIEAAHETFEVRPSERTETSKDVLVVFGPCRQIIPSKQLAILGCRVLVVRFCGRDCLPVRIPLPQGRRHLGGLAANSGGDTRGVQSLFGR